MLKTTASCSQSLACSCWPRGFALAGDPPPSGPAGTSAPAPPPGATPAPPARRRRIAQDPCRREQGLHPHGNLATASLGPADRHPTDHPVQMPDVVARMDANLSASQSLSLPEREGTSLRTPASPACPSILQEDDERLPSGARKSAEPRKANTNVMITIAKGHDRRGAAGGRRHFCLMKWTPWIKVVESQTVPKTRSLGRMASKLEGTPPSRSPDTHRRDARTMRSGTETPRRPSRSPFTGIRARRQPRGGKTPSSRPAATARPSACAICRGEGLHGL